MSDGVLRRAQLTMAWVCPWCGFVHRLDVGPGVDLAKPRVVVCVRCEKLVEVMPL